MNLLDAILNLAGLVLWADWRAGMLASKAPVSVLSLANSLKRTERAPLRPWFSLGGLALLLVVRAFLYHSIGSAVNWTALLDLGAITLPFRTDYLSRAFLFSFGSFALLLGAVYSGLLLVAAVDFRVPAEHPVKRFVRAQLGWLGKLPAGLLLLLPMAVSTLAWVGAASPLSWLELLPADRPARQVWAQGASLGLASYLVWRWALIGLFAAHLLNAHVYLGDHPIWDYLSRVSATLLSPVRFLRLPKFDFAPVFGILAVIGFAEFAAKPLVRLLYQRLPL